MNNVFISCCLGISILGSKPELLRHRKDKRRTTPSENQEFLFCSVITFLEPRVSQLRAMKETNNKNLCCSRIKKYLLSLSINQNQVTVELWGGWLRKKIVFSACVVGAGDMGQDCSPSPPHSPAVKRYLPGGTVGYPAQPGLTWRNQFLLVTQPT